MIPFYKAFSLIMRVFSRPLIAYTKKYHSSQQSQSRYVRLFFIRLGNFYHRTETNINRRFLKIDSEFAYKPLNDQLAIERGIQFFYEIIFYSIVIGLPVYEMYRQSADSDQNSQQVDRRLTFIEKQSDSVLSQLTDITAKLKGQQKMEEKQRQQTALELAIYSQKALDNLSVTLMPTTAKDKQPANSEDNARHNQ